MKELQKFEKDRGTWRLELTRINRIHRGDPFEGLEGHSWVVVLVTNKRTDWLYNI